MPLHRFELRALLKVSGAATQNQFQVSRNYLKRRLFFGWREAPDAWIVSNQSKVAGGGA